MTLHELATNAAKHGALSTDTGRVALSWSVEAGRLRLEWRETGGPTVRPPDRRGYGMKVLTRALEGIGGRTSVDWAHAGLICTAELPLTVEPVTEAFR